MYHSCTYISVLHVPWTSTLYKQGSARISRHVVQHAKHGGKHSVHSRWWRLLLLRKTYNGVYAWGGGGLNVCQCDHPWLLYILDEV